MSKKFPKEFQEEVVKQMVDRGYSVNDVASRLGVSAQSLYKWGKAVSPTEEDRFSKPLNEKTFALKPNSSALRRIEIS